MYWTINTPVDFVCSAQLLKQKSFALECLHETQCKRTVIFTKLLSRLE